MTNQLLVKQVLKVGSAVLCKVQTRDADLNSTYTYSVKMDAVNDFLAGKRVYQPNRFYKINKDQYEDIDYILRNQDSLVTTKVKSVANTERYKHVKSVRINKG